MIIQIILAILAIKLGLFNIVLSKKEQRKNGYIWSMVALIACGIIIITQLVFKTKL